MIKIMINMKIVAPYYLIKLILEKLSIAKQLFIFEIQTGKEVFIPAELSQDYLPQTFRYYDFILNYVMDNVSQDTKELYTFVNDMRLKFYKSQKSMMETIKGKIGMSSDKTRLAAKNKLVSEKAINEIS